jgi:MoxR-like ATPase
MSTSKNDLEQLAKDFDLESYQPLSVVGQLRCAILSRLKKGEDVLPNIDGRKETKADFIRAILSGSHPYLISEEGTGKTRLALSLVSLLPPIPIIKGCPYHDDPLWEQHLLCSRCGEVKNPVEKFGIEFITAETRFSRVQGNEYTNEAKLLGLKDIQAIAGGASPSDPNAFIGTGIFRANRGILMIDELPAIRTKVQVLLHPLLEESKAVLEEYNWERFVDLLLIATGNPSGFSHVHEIPRPLLDRLEMIFMDLPEEEVEKEILMKERPPMSPDEDTFEKWVVQRSTDHPIEYDLMKRKAVVPWWALEALNKTVRYSRQSTSLEKKPSLRSGTRAFEHTVSSAEMAGHTIASLHDTFLGLKLALRGRIGLMPDFIDFDNPEKTIKQTDQVVEDMLRDVLNDVCGQFFKEVDFNQEGLIKEIATVYGKDAPKDASIDWAQYPELTNFIDWMVNSWRSKMPLDNLTQEEKDIFDQKTEIAEDVTKEYRKSALAFIAAGANIRGIVKEEVLTDQLFVPKRVIFSHR